MFNWLGRKAQLQTFAAAEQDISRFISGLRAANDYEVGAIVAMATHWRNVFVRDGIELLDPAAAERRAPIIPAKIDELIRQLQPRQPQYAIGLTVWLHSIRAASTPELRSQGRQMWAELRRGFTHADDAAAEFYKLTGKALVIDNHAQTPPSLLPF
jgi:hypothetical protein